jgi:endonuclease/exonuclease/phosphatase family metal-dependent hydrolase
MVIRILSYNIHKGFDTFNRRFILGVIKEQIRHLQPDVVCLQEVQGEHAHHKNKVPGYPIESQFEFLADTVWPHFAYGKNAIYSHGHHGNAILSRFPITRWSNLDLSLDKSEMRGMLHAEINLPEENRTFHVLTTHLNLFHRARVRQTDRIVEYVNRNLATDVGFTLVGDFNDWLLELDPIMKKKLQVEELFATLYGRHARTFPCFYPRLALDRAYLRHHKPVNGMVLNDGPWNELSDHLPLYIEVDV